MTKISHLPNSDMFLSIVKTYSISILLALSAVPLAISCGTLYPIGALILCAGSIFFTRGLEREAERCRRLTIMFDEQLEGRKKLSSMDELSAGIAHEINNPLAIISQETQWMHHLLQSLGTGDVKAIEDFKESVRSISLQVDRCREIVQKLLSLARQTKPVFQKVDLNTLIQSIIHIVERDAASKNIRIMKHLQENLPVLQSDPPLVRQVILNLLINASQAMEGRGTIFVSTKLKDGFVDIVVEDTGSGITPENLSKIFVPFFSTKPEGKGTGLGLAICRGMIEVLGGHISVTSEEGKNTVFTVSLPAERPK